MDLKGLKKVAPRIPRQIPAQSWFMKPGFTILVGGVLPFGAVFTELFFIMWWPKASNCLKRGVLRSSIWQHQFYYLFGFLALVWASPVFSSRPKTSFSKGKGKGT